MKKVHPPIRAILGEPTYSFLQNVANGLHEKQKVGSARRVTRQAGSPFCDGRVALLAGPTFLQTLWHYQTDQLAQSETIRACARLLLAWAKRSIFSPYKRLLKARRVTQRIRFWETAHLPLP